MKKRIGPKFDKDGYEENFDGLNADDLVFIKDPRLPSPKEIAKSLKNARISIVLDDETVDYFKDEANKHKVSYQKMIRQVLRHYRQSHRRAA